jgi:hypothetical protein
LSEYLFSLLQKLPTDSLAQLPEKSQMPDLSQDTLTQRTAENTTSALKALPASTDAQSELSSRSETLMAQATAKDQKMFPDGKFPLLTQLTNKQTNHTDPSNCY